MNAQHMSAIAALRSHRGSVLLASFFLVAGIFIVQSAIYVYTLTDYRAAQRNNDLVKAMYMSEAGVDQAIGELRYQTNYTGESSDFGITGHYDIAVAPTGYVDVTATPFPLVEYRVNSTGNHPWNTLQARQRAVVGMTMQAMSPFSYALFADEGIRIFAGSLTTTSFDSRLADAPTNWGRVGTNVAGASSIVIGGGTDTHGADLLCGTACVPAVAIVLGPPVTNIGNRLALAEPKRLDSVNVPPITPEPNINVADDGTHTITAPGDHVYGRIILGKRARLEATAPVRLFVTGGVFDMGEDAEVEASGGDAPNLLIYVSDTTNVAPGPVQWGPNTSITAGIYVAFTAAPDPAVRIADTTITGSLIVHGRMQADGDITVNYDLALNNMRAGVDRTPEDYVVTSTSWLMQE